MTSAFFHRVTSRMSGSLMRGGPHNAWVYGCGSRSWAVRRAPALGVDAVRIREAILTHARNAPSKTVIERGQLWDLTLVGLELGILHEIAHPDVESPLRRSTT